MSEHAPPAANANKNALIFPLLCDRATGRQGDRATGRQGDRATGRQGDRATGRSTEAYARGKQANSAPHKQINIPGREASPPQKKSALTERSFLNIL
ncbi:hypothetical protein ACLEIY_16565 [Acetobacter tropicalis]|uniref:hypothetical protein n=1 Tax=Acetobacter tropicalis TaxID=104102 RepID=UPI003975A80F